MFSTETAKFVVAMIIMLNPLGTLPIFLDLTRTYTAAEQHKTAMHTTLAIIALMLLTLWSGNALLEVLGITIPAFNFAGGIILLLMGLSMLQSRQSPVSHTPGDDLAAKERQSPAIVPLALPVIVGPGAMSTLIITVGTYPAFLSKVWLSCICFLLALGMGFMLYYAGVIAKMVGTSVIKVVTRIMGMLIMAIAVEMLAKGLLGLIPSLQG